MPASLSDSMVAALRAAPRRTPDESRRAFLRLLELWRNRLGSDWRPNGPLSFPWAQIRLSLAALIAETGATPASESQIPEPGARDTLALVIAAGNTPLVTAPAFLHTVALGVPLIIKASRDDPFGPRLLHDLLAEINPDAAARIALTDDAPGSESLDQLISLADRVIAYGGDDTLADVRGKTAPGASFLGFGHALSFAIATRERLSPEIRPAFARACAVDLLMYGQGGCLSPQALFVEGSVDDAVRLARAIADRLPAVARELDVAPVTDPARAQTVRVARDLAGMDGALVLGDSALRWTLLVTDNVGEPVGACVLPVVAIASPGDLVSRLTPWRGKISCLGGVDTNSASRFGEAARELSVGRLCDSGEMQTPPLSWQNGGVDLANWLAR